MQKKIKILRSFARWWKLQAFLPTKMLLDICNSVEEVNKHEDLLIHSVNMGEFKNVNKTLLISGEPLFLQNPLMSYINYLPFKYFCYKYAPSFILNIRIRYIRPYYVNLLSEMQQGKHKDIYAVICNDTQADNIFNIPYFILQLNEVTNGFASLSEKKQIATVPEKFCCAVVSNDWCVERNDFYKALAKYKKIDIYGRHFLNNADNTKISDVSDFTNHKLFKTYKFVICFENSYTNEYITNKLVEPMMANTVPIYRGAPNTGDYFNTDSFINYDNYGNYQQMIDKIIELDNDDTKYKSFLEQPYMTAENKAYIDSKKRGLKVFLTKIVGTL